MTNNEFLWLPDVYLLVSQEKIDDAIDVIYEQIDALCCQGQFLKVDDFLKVVDLNKLDLSTMLGVLTITLAPAPHLPYRKTFFGLVKEHITKYEPNRVEALLKGLKGLDRKR